MNQWYPDVNTKMTYVSIKDKSMLFRYVLHAKHKKMDGREDKCEWLLDDETADEIVKQARPFII